MTSKTQLINQVAIDAVSRAGNPGRKMHEAIRYANLMRRDGVDFATMADAFAILASWEGKRGECPADPCEQQSVGTG